MSLLIQFYKTNRGDEPVQEYLDALSEKDRENIDECIQTLKMEGFLEMPHGRKMSGYEGLYEVRSGRHRILYGIKNGMAIFVHAFMKKSQQTSQRDIDLALRRLGF